MDTASRRGSDGLRGRLIRGLMWFALAIMPARERWVGFVFDRPYAIVQDHDGPVSALNGSAFPATS